VSRTEAALETGKTQKQRLHYGGKEVAQRLHLTKVRRDYTGNKERANR